MVAVLAKMKKHLPTSSHFGRYPSSPMAIASGRVLLFNSRQPALIATWSTASKASVAIRSAHS